MQVYADGEHVGSLPAMFEIVPGALTVVAGPRRERDPMSHSADGVLLIHAFPLDARMWDRQVRTLGTLDGRWWRRRCPGSATPTASGAAMTMGAAADRCLQAADAAGMERFVVCGLSMGGYVAFELWRMARQRIAGLVLANTRSGADAPEAAHGRRALADRLDTEGNGFLVEQPPPLLSDQAPAESVGAGRGAIAAQPATSIGAAARGMAERDRTRRPTSERSTCPC